MVLVGEILDEDLMHFYPQKSLGCHIPFRMGIAGGGGGEGGGEEKGEEGGGRGRGKKGGGTMPFSPCIPLFPFGLMN